MKNKLKFLLSLFLCLSLTACDNKVFIGNNKVYIAPKTVLGLEYSRSGYKLDNVEFDVYMGFSDIEFEYDIFYGIYLTNSVSFQNNKDWIDLRISSLNLPGHQLIATFTEYEALTQYSFDVKKHRIVYNDSIKVKADKTLFYRPDNYKVYSGTIKVLAVTFAKTTDGTYKVVLDRETNQAVEFFYEVDKNDNVYFNEKSFDINSIF